MEVDLTGDESFSEDPFKNESEYEYDVGEESEEESQFSCQQRQSNGNYAGNSSTSSGIRFANVFEDADTRASTHDNFNGEHFQNQIRTFPEKISSDADENSSVKDESISVHQQSSRISDDQQPSPNFAPSSTSSKSTAANNRTVVAPQRSLLEIKFENLSKVTQRQWLELFKTFNARVWPICFNIKLIKFRSITMPSENHWIQLVEPFRGVIKKSGNFDWTKSSPKKGKLTKELQIVYDEMYNRLEDSTLKTPSILRVSHSDYYAVKNVDGKVFTFDCEVKGKAAKESAVIKILFTNFHYSNLGVTAQKKFRLNMYNIYNNLWNAYYRKRIPL
jgi:hypothetical protein